MTVTCKNCGELFAGNFCNNCGQPSDTHKMNMHFLIHDIQHGLFHFDKGILYSAKELFTRPGHSIREFLEGKRVKHFKPISLVIILATLYGLLYHLSHINLINVEEKASKINFIEVNEWISTHYSWVTLGTIPFYTLGTFICFKKQGYNFIELLIFNTYKASQRLIFHIVIFPLLFFYNGTEHQQKVTLFIYVIDLVLIFWTNIQFFDRLSKTKTFLLSVLSHLLFFIFFATSIGILIFAYEMFT